MYQKVIELHNRIEALPILDPEIKDYHGRPYKVIMSDQIVDVLIEDISDKELKSLRVENIALDIKLDSVDFTE